MEKQFYPTIGNDFRAYSKQRDCGGFEFGIQKRIKLFGITIWITIKKYYSCHCPKVKIGCIEHNFYKLVDWLNI